MKRVVAIVVTYNRVDYLKECISAILKQVSPVSEVLVIDNHSSDGTQELMENITDNYSCVNYVRLSKNIGGSGGFFEGIKRSMSLNSDYLWIMDDDTIVDQNTLSKLLDADRLLDSDWGFLSSNVRWKDGSSAKMNQLMPEKFWSEKVDDGLIAVRSGTFVSILVKSADVRKYGLPIPEFFIWGDDTEYTQRMSSDHQGYFVANSHVVHKTQQNLNVDIINEKIEEKLARYFYSYRNSFYNSRMENRGWIFFFKSLVTLTRLIKANDRLKWKKIRMLCKGLYKGAFFNPEIRFYRSQDE